MPSAQYAASGNARRASEGAVAPTICPGRRVCACRGTRARPRGSRRSRSRRGSSRGRGPGRAPTASRPSSRITSFTLRSVSGAFSAICAATSRTRASSRAFGTTSFTIPRARASSAVKRRAVNSTSLAVEGPDESHQCVDAGGVVAEPEPGGGNRELRVVRGDAQVCGQRERHAAADAEAVDRGDDGLADVRRAPRRRRRWCPRRTGRRSRRCACW